MPCWAGWKSKFETNGAFLPVLFHLFEPRVHDLFHAQELGAEDISGIADLTAQVRAQIVDPPIRIAQPTMIHEDADEHRQGWYADGQERLSGIGPGFIVARGLSAHLGKQGTAALLADKALARVQNRDL